MADDLDTPFGEPMTMQEALEKADSLMTQTKEADPVETSQEAEQELADDAAVEAEAEIADETEVEESEATDDGPQLLTVDEYGDVLIDLNGEATPLSDVVKGTLRQSDYSRKTQEHARAVKEAEAKFEAREKELEAREARLAETAAEFEDQEPDWSALAEEDPLGWPKAKADWDKKSKAKAEREAEAKTRTDAQKREFLLSTIEPAVNRFPEWQDINKFDEGATARKDMALEMGFSEAEYASAVDFRLAALLEIAVRNKAGSVKVDAAAKQIAKAPKVLKPGASRGDIDPAKERRAAIQKRLSKPVDSAELLRSLGVR